MAKADELLADDPADVSTTSIEAPKEALLKRDSALPTAA
jgi:hypothetical protein